MGFRTTLIKINRRPRFIVWLLIFSMMAPWFSYPAPARAAAAPVVTAPASITMNEGGIIMFNVTASDPDGLAIDSLTSSSLPPGANFIAGSTHTRGALTWSLGFDQAGTYDVTFTASAGSPAVTGSATTHIVVTNLDRAPVVTAPATINATTGSLTVFAVAASDPDGDTITALTASPLPTGATFTANATNTGGTFSWTPTSAQTGNYTISFTAANARSGSATTGLPVTLGSNQPPVINDIPTTTTNWGQTATIDFTVTDQDSDTLTIGLNDNLDNPPATDPYYIETVSSTPGLFIGKYHWSPAPNAPLTDYVAPFSEICASDGVNSVVCKNFTIFVLAPAPNRPPVAHLSVFPTGMCTGDWAYLDGSNSYDPDGFLTRAIFDFDDGPTYEITAALGFPLEIPSLVPKRYTAPGSYTPKLTVFDNNLPLAGADLVNGQAITVMDPFSPTPPTPAPTYHYGLPLNDPITGLPNAGAGLTLGFNAVSGDFDPTQVDLTLADTTLTYTDGNNVVHTINPLTAQTTATGVSFSFDPTDLDTMFASLSHVNTVSVVLAGKINGRACGQFSMNANIIVNRPDRAPVFDQIDDATIHVVVDAYHNVTGGELVFPVKATDPDGDVVTTHQVSGLNCTTQACLNFPGVDPPGEWNRSVEWHRIQPSAAGTYDASICIWDSPYLMQTCTSFTITIDVTMPTDFAPVAQFTSSPTTSICTGDSFSFDGTSSTDEDGTVTGYNWNFGDSNSLDNTSTSSTPRHSYDISGTYWPGLTVTDNGGVLSLQKRSSVEVRDPFVGDIPSPPFYQPPPLGPLFLPTSSEFNAQPLFIYVGGHFILPAGSFDSSTIGIDESSLAVHYTQGGNDIVVPVENPFITYFPTNYNGPAGVYVTALISNQDADHLFGSITGHDIVVNIRFEGRFTNVSGCNRFSVEVPYNIVRDNPPVLGPVSDTTIFRDQSLTLVQPIGSDPDGDTFQIVHSGDIPDLPCAVSNNFNICLGTFTVTYTAVDKYGARSAPVFQHVTVLNRPPRSKPYIFTPAPYCVGKPIQFGNDSYDPDVSGDIMDLKQLTWDFNDGSPILTGPPNDLSEPTVNAPWHTYTAIGTYHPSSTAMDYNLASTTATMTAQVLSSNIYTKYADLGSSTGLTYTQGSPGDLILEVSPHKKEFDVANWNQGTTRLSVPALSADTIPATLTQTTFAGGPGIYAKFDNNYNLIVLLSKLPKSSQKQDVKFLLTGDLTNGNGCNFFKYVFTVSVLKKT